MRNIKAITSLTNPYIKRLVNLRNKKFRDNEKIFIVEGYHLVQEAKKYLLDVLIVDEADYVEGVCNYLVTKEIISKVSTSKTPQNIIGVCKYIENVTLKGERYLLLDNIQDPGNLGTIIRSALGFGIDTIIASSDTVDIYNEKVIRATQGALFNINYIKGDLEKYIALLKENNIKIIGTSLNSCVDLKSVKKINRYAIVLGNEGSGVRDEVLQLSDFNVKIDIDEKLESLNVAIAGAIIMFYLYK